MSLFVWHFVIVKYFWISPFVPNFRTNQIHSDYHRGRELLHGLRWFVDNRAFDRHVCKSPFDSFTSPLVFSVFRIPNSSAIYHLLISSRKIMWRRKRENVKSRLHWPVLRSVRAIYVQTGN